MMNNILGQFGLGGRLGDNIRERQGMAYYAYSTLDASSCGAAHHSRRRRSRERRAHARGHRSGGRGRWADAADRRPKSSTRSQRVPDRLDSAACSKRTPASPRSCMAEAVRSRPRLRRPSARDFCARSRWTSARGGAPTARSRRAAAIAVAGPRRDRVTDVIARRVTRAVFFDVDFTLIHPGPTFQAERLSRLLCPSRRRRRRRRHSTRRLRGAVASARDHDGRLRSRDLRPTTRAASSRAWAGAGPVVELAAREIYDEWSACHHFEMYDDVPDVLRALRAPASKIGLISNSHRCLTRSRALRARRAVLSRGLVLPSTVHEAAPSIFEAALRRSAVAAGEAVMVGDSLDA